MPCVSALLFWAVALCCCRSAAAFSVSQRGGHIARIQADGVTAALARVLNGTVQNGTAQNRTAQNGTEQDDSVVHVTDKRIVVSVRGGNKPVMNSHKTTVTVGSAHEGRVQNGTTQNGTQHHVSVQNESMHNGKTHNVTTVHEKQIHVAVTGSDKAVIDSVTSHSQNSSGNVGAIRKAAAQAKGVVSQSSSSANATSSNMIAANISNVSLSSKSEKNKTKPFAHRTVTVDVNVTHSASGKVVVQETVRTVVQLATAKDIISVYLLMFVPLGMLWAAFAHYDRTRSYYSPLLALTLCVFAVGLDLVNQSLSVLMEAPNAITAIQALALVVMSCGIWAGCWLQQRHSGHEGVPMRELLRPLACWSVCSALFATIQMLQHYISFTCTLSERTVFLNVAPLLTMGCERCLLAPGRETKLSFLATLALWLMVLGAVLFVLGDAVTINGLLAACLLDVFLVPYRLIQRILLNDILVLPVTIASALDGLILIVPAIVGEIMSRKRDVGFFDNWITWWTTPSVATMLVLSMLSFTGLHISTLSLLRAVSATSTIVFTNIASIVLVILGIGFFGDKTLQSATGIVGVCLSLGGGLWYAFELQLGTIRSNRQSTAKETEQAPEDTVPKGSSSASIVEARRMTS